MAEHLIRIGFACAWATLVAYWIPGYFRATPERIRIRWRARLSMMSPVLVFYALVLARVIPVSWLRAQLWPEQLWLKAAGLVVTVSGVALSIWAKRTLGANWSGMPKIQQVHELVVTGPYRAVRHPIYTGLLLALLGATVAIGSGGWVAGWLMALAILLIKLRIEERLLRAAFPEAYAGYSRRVKALVPWIF